MPVGTSSVTAAGAPMSNPVNLSSEKTSLVSRELAKSDCGFLSPMKLTGCGSDAICIPGTSWAVPSTGMAFISNGDEVSHSTERRTTVSGGTNKKPLSVKLACESVVVGPESKLKTGGVMVVGT